MYQLVDRALAWRPSFLVLGAVIDAVTVVVVVVVSKRI